MTSASHPNYVARYKHETDGRPRYSLKPVASWNDGTAQVVDRRTGRLVDADSFSNFADVLVDDTSPVVAAVPGGGWLAEYRAEDGSTWTMTVVVWNVREDGTLDPMCVDSDGVSGDPTDDKNFVRLYLSSDEPAPE